MRASRVFLLLFFSVVALGISFVVAWKGYQQHQEKEAISQEVEKLQEEAHKLETETQQLNNRIAYLQTPEYTEREVKEKLNLKKPEENVAVVQPDRFQKKTMDMENEGSIKRGVSVVSSGSISNPMKWWNYFFALR